MIYLIGSVYRLRRKMYSLVFLQLLAFIVINRGNTINNEFYVHFTRLLILFTFLSVGNKFRFAARWHITSYGKGSSHHQPSARTKGHPK